MREFREWRADADLMNTSTVRGEHVVRESALCCLRNSRANMADKGDKRGGGGFRRGHALRATRGRGAGADLTNRTTVRGRVVGRMGVRCGLRDRGANMGEYVRKGERWGKTARPRGVPARSWTSAGPASACAPVAANGQAMPSSSRCPALASRRRRAASIAPRRPGRAGAARTEAVRRTRHASADFRLYGAGGVRGGLVGRRCLREGQVKFWACGKNSEAWGNFRAWGNARWRRGHRLLYRAGVRVHVGRCMLARLPELFAQCGTDDGQKNK